MLLLFILNWYVAPDQLLSEVTCHLLGIVNYSTIQKYMQLLKRSLLEQTTPDITTIPDVTTTVKAITSCTTADDPTTVEATTAEDSRAQIYPIEKQMVLNKVHQIETSQQQPMIPQLKQVPEPRNFPLGQCIYQVRLTRAVRLQ